jgi:hypothetical protein
MHIGNVKGNGGIERGGERTVRLQPQEARDAGRVQQDVAAISAGGQRAASAAERLAQRAKAEDPARAQLVEAARARLQSGELDDRAVLHATAQKVLDSAFLAG